MNFFPAQYEIKPGLPYDPGTTRGQIIKEILQLGVSDQSHTLPCL